MSLNVKDSYGEIFIKKDQIPTIDNGALYLEYQRLNNRGELFEELLTKDNEDQYLKYLEEVYFGKSEVKCLNQYTRKEIERILNSLGERQCAILNSIMIN